MKYRELAKQLREQGWYFLREGGNHEIWTNGNLRRAVPRHRNIAEPTAWGLIREAKRYPGRKP